MLDKRKFYINGKWEFPFKPNDLEVINPSNEDPYAIISLGSIEDVNKAVKAAKIAFESWKKTSKDERLKLLENLLKIYKKRFDDMAKAISDEMGAPMDWASDVQTASGQAHLEDFILRLKEFKFEEHFDSKSNNHICYEPIGVCGLITPWNWPINQIALKVIPAFATGCTMILKPSEIAPISAMLFAEMVDEAGFPPGVFNLVNGDGAGVGTDLSAHNEIDMISVNSNPFYNIHSKILFSLKNPKNFSLYFNRLNRLYMKTNINDHLYQYYGNTKKIKLVFVPHHLSHSCASVFTSGLKNGLAISFDAAGDFSTFEVYDVNNLKFKKISSLKFPHSFGILYQALTQYLGFKDYGDEYKVMGLAAYGEPRYLDELKKLYYLRDGKFRLNLKYFTHHKIGFNFNFKNNYPFLIACAKTNKPLMLKRHYGSSLRDWFGRKGAKGKKKGWVDCNSPDGKGGYKSCGRSSGEKRSKYPSCRPTPGACKERGKGKSWGKKAAKGKKG